MLRGQALSVLAGLLFLASLVTDKTIAMLFGFGFVVGAYKLYQQKRVDFRHDFMSSSGLATMLLFFAYVLFGIMFIIGSYTLPIVGWSMTAWSAQIVAAVVILLGFLDVNFKRR